MAIDDYIDLADLYSNDLNDYCIICKYCGKNNLRWEKQINGNYKLKEMNIKMEEMFHDCNKKENMIKYTKGFKEVELYGFAKFVEKWNKYYCLECKTYFKKPKELYNRPNECCRDDAWDDGYDEYCPKCNSSNFEYPIDVARRIWNKERPKDTV